LGSVALFKREIMLVRQREGISRAKALGKFKGRKPTVRLQADEFAACGQGNGYPMPRLLAD